ncbi:conserved hypothetical protein [Alteromonas sp. 38]|uniref:DUF6776 family protein n=1 Tax=Alteromonas TaxID=226 RepID=UPI0012F0C62F|nr:MULTISPECIES: DUF6776 family protein [Alteromonas]CAD5261379.1 conserved hypothetical protein [Alteromonas sp. 154]VXC28695.1 conserved hypothetical protein [Alteromonas sp. 38]
MTTDKLKQLLGNYKWSLLVAALSLLMMAFGYKLARIADEGDSLKVDAQDKTIALLVSENNQYVTQVNQLEVALHLTELEKKSISEQLNNLQKEQTELQEQLAFYQRIMAPETTQDGFVIEGVEVVSLAEPNQFQMRFVVLQQRQNKALVKGKLAITLSGEREGKELTVSIGDPGFISQEIEYRFKYFQAVNTSFTLPDGFQPTSITLTTTVFQYNSRRGDLAKKVTWEDALNSDSILDDTQ